MLSVVKAAGATLANGSLQLVYQDSSGHLQDVFAASFQIYDSNLAQIYPAILGNKQALDLTVSGANRAGKGRYNAVWVSSAQGVGPYIVRWYLTPTSGAAEIAFDQDFEIVPEAYRGPHYCGISDLREEGLMAVDLSDRDAQKAIVRASRYIQLYTGREFSPVYTTLELNGRRSRALIMNEPIVALEKVSVTYDSGFSSDTEIADTSAYKVFNRHLTEKLIRPDDRDDPRLEYVHCYDTFDSDENRSVFGERLVWPTGQRNVQLVGLFGYTEADESYTGRTPDLIREVCKMLVFSNNVPMIEGVNTVGPVTAERTRDQAVSYAKLRTTALTGNRGVDNILTGFRRAPGFGAA